MIGAYMGEGDELDEIDAAYLIFVSRLASHYGFTLPENPKVDVINLIYDGDDFLINQPRADLIIFSYIFYSFEGAFMRDLRHADYRQQSRHSFEAERWHKALKATGAKMAVNIVGEDRRTELP